MDDLISIDIGGTSCDIALINAGRPALRSEGKIEGYPVRVNMVDVNTIGAGGGSLVWLDGAGGLHVGPGSAGADPGPACYGRGGDRATVTDASTMLGYLNPEYFAGGSIDIDPQRAYDAIEKTIAEPLGITVERAAQGIHRVVNAQIAEGIRLVSIRRGYDPRRFALVALGGAGPVHATALADELGISKIVVPRNPGVLSATGLLVAPIEHEATISLLRDLADLPPSVVAAALGDTDNQCRSLMAAEGVATSAVEIRHLADVCYVGQSYHLEVQLHMDDRMPLDRLYRDFKDEHDLVHGHATDAPARLVNLRSVHTLGREQDLRFDESDVDRGDSLKGQRPVLFVDDEEPWMAAIHERQSLAPAARIEGPAIIEQPDTTTVVTRGWRAVVHTSRNLILEKASTREKLDRNGRL
ncbi:MAG TPA: hydantoinase/oxoprolinase family protein [Rhodospirillales bacterium]|nr:hydantoinase/oxoprolinase family protein [Rhodospirillales bacterium]